MTPAEQAVLATLSYYDILDFPLTSFEIWRHLIAARNAQPIDYPTGELFTDLRADGPLRELVGQKYGFHYLRGREEIVEKRLRRKKLADMKWKRLRPTLRRLSVVPFARAIFVSGSLAMENSKVDSDVDVIVVARSGRIWTVRTFMTVWTTLLGVRRHGAKTRDRICLNHYITDQSLRIPFESLYNAESYVHLVNAYAEDEELFARFQRENDWIGRYVANYRVAELRSTRSTRRSRPLRALARGLELLLSGWVGDRLESCFAWVEGGRIRRQGLWRQAGGRITVDENQLEFHPDSHEQFVIPEFNRRMEALGLGAFANQADSGLNK